MQCWCPEDQVQARRRHEEVQKAVRAAGGEVADVSLREIVGLSLLRIVIAASRVRELAQVDRIRRIDVLPRPLLRYPQFRSATRESLPLVLDPASTAPTLAVIDSGIVSAHPLLAPAVIGVEAISPDLADGGDQHGHGTLVASLALYGSLESALAERSPVRPAGRLLSLRVLDANGGKRTVTVALAFDPKIRPTRMDYLASRMMVRAYRGISLEEVRDAYVRQLELPAPTQDDENSNQDTTPPALRRYEIGLEPSDKHRAQGAHQYGTRIFSQRFKSERGNDLILAVRNTKES